MESASRDDARDHVSKLYRGNGDGTLTDSHGDGFSRIPLLMKDSLLPSLRRHDPSLFAGQVNSRSVSEAEIAGIK